MRYITYFIWNNIFFQSHSKFNEIIEEFGIFLFILFYSKLFENILISMFLFYNCKNQKNQKISIFTEEKIKEK